MCNCLPNEVRESTNIHIFKKHIKTYLFKVAYEHNSVWSVHIFYCFNDLFWMYFLIFSYTFLCNPVFMISFMLVKLHFMYEKYYTINNCIIIKVKQKLKVKFGLTKWLALSILQCKWYRWRSCIQHICRVLSTCEVTNICIFPFKKWSKASMS